ncbi:uncharacterized protein LOC141884871 [Acropora palmata]|uniref:uncharacterized protein LOC141884871 n=1 Tax=Acropora palmata TaxID=6131 RepID=UPI003DA05A59
MRLSGWIRCLICSTFLFSFHTSEPSTGNQTTDQHRFRVSNETELTRCSCIDEKERKYNLASLAERDGSPRFTVRAKDNYSYSYNPCVSFTLGSFGDCSEGNVAVCRWTNTSYENIGYQGTARCALQWDGTPILVYPTKPEQWLSVVSLQCDPKRKSIQSAEFSVIRDDKPRPVRFQLKHNCACPNACPDETPTRQFRWKTVGVPILVAAGCFLLLCTACIANCRLLTSRRNLPPEVTPLIGEEGRHRGSDMRYNTAGALNQTEATSDSDEEFVTASSTMTKV